MSRNSYCIRSGRAVARDLGIAAVLLATMGLSPVVAAADDDASARQRTARGLLLSVDDAGIVLHRSAEPDLRLTVDAGTHVAKDGQSASVSDLRGGEEVRASYQEADGVAKAIRIEAQSEEGQPVRTMSPDDPAWNEVHQGG